MGNIPFPTPTLRQAGPACKWNAANPQGFMSVGGTNNKTATLSQTSGQGGAFATNYGSVIGTVGKFNKRAYFEVAQANLTTSVGFQIAISPQINTSAAQGYYFGKPGMGIYAGMTNGASSTVVECDDLNYSGVNLGAGAINDVYGVALDGVNDLVWWSLNGVYYGWSQPDPATGGSAVVGNPASGYGGIAISHTIYYPGFQGVLVRITGSFSCTATLKTRLSEQVYGPPLGFRAWDQA